jgi:phosphate-selective porin OprO and OprP
VNPWAPLHLSFGYRRTPLFHIAKDELFEAMVVPELPVAIRSFWPGVELGVELHYEPTAHVPVEAWARIGNGSGTPLGNNTDKLAYEARVDLVLGRARADGYERDTFWLRLGTGVHIGTLENETGVSGCTADNYVFFRPAVVNGLQSLGEAHLVVWAGRAMLDVEVGRVMEERGVNETGNASAPLLFQPSAQSWGGFAELAYMIWGAPRIPGAWPNAHRWNASLAHGGVEIGTRFDCIALDHDVPGITAGGAKGGEVAVRWWATSFLAVAVAGYYLRYDVAPVEEWLTLWRATFSWR